MPPFAFLALSLPMLAIGLCTYLLIFHSTTCSRKQYYLGLSISLLSISLTFLMQNCSSTSSLLVFPLVLVLLSQVFNINFLKLWVNPLLPFLGILSIVSSYEAFSCSVCLFVPYKVARRYMVQGRRK